jgi:hypothetical protein
MSCIQPCCGRRVGSEGSKLDGTCQMVIIRTSHMSCRQQLSTTIVDVRINYGCENFDGGSDMSTAGKKKH